MNTEIGIFLEVVSERGVQEYEYLGREIKEWYRCGTLLCPLIIID